VKWNETNMTGRWISQAYRSCQIFMDRKLRRFEIGSGQFIFLLALYNHDGVSQESLAKALNFNKGTTAVAMKQLEAQEYIVREIDSSDKRYHRVCITEKARAIESEFMEIVTNWTDILTNGFSEREKSAVADFLKRMSENAAAAINEEGSNTTQ
jgi:DNA-binding MarR family transcriptional regulator